MELEKIVLQLNQEFASSQRKIVFWYDENEEFKEDVEKMTIENAKIFILNKRNYFKAKYEIEYENPTGNYLVYAPFEFPKDDDNPLLDIYLYSKPFYADYYSLLCEDLNLPTNLRSSLVKYENFFKNKTRLTSFKKWSGSCTTTNQLETALMAVLTKSKLCEFSEIFKQIISDDLENNKYLIELEKYDLIESFWKLSNSYFGYVDRDQKPSLKKLVASIFVTNIYDVSNTSLPTKLNKYLLRNISEATVFLTNYKNDIASTNRYEEIAEEIANELNIDSVINSMSIDQIKNNDVFENFDKNVIDKLTLFASNQSNLDKVDEWLVYRENGHYYPKYQHDYLCLQYAFNLLSAINYFTNNCHSITVDEYANNYSKIDKYYHLYVYHYMRHVSSCLVKLDTLIENKYVNDYLFKINQYFDITVGAISSSNQLCRRNQSDFYYNFVRENETKEKLCVIISDAFRYECGVQLNDYLNDQAKYTSSIDHMISNVPSTTELGMAALLPHNKLELDSKGSVLLDGQSTSGLNNRNAILAKRFSGAMAVNYDDIKSLSRDDLRNKVQKAQILYVYHNQIDARGDHSLTEDEVFNASQEGIFEIERIMRKLRDDANYSKFIITADHGFIYRRQKLDEADKIVISNKDVVKLNQRYILSATPVYDDGVSEWDLSDLSNQSNLHIYTPNSVNIIKTGANGQNYVHGGSSLQEMVIPLITVKTTARKVEVKQVDVSPVLSANPVINHSSYSIRFIQIEPVTDKMLGATYKAYFVDKDGVVITNECMIYATSKSTDLNERTTVCKFNFINKAYSTMDNYYLIIENKTGVEISRTQFMIDIVSTEF